jgi:hypothetical protein
MSSDSSVESKRVDRLRALTILSALLGLATAPAALLSQGPLPGDVEIIRSFQAALGTAPAWANVVTKTAMAPWVWLTAGLAAGMACARGARIYGLAPPVALTSVYALDMVLRRLIFEPKPSPDLVAVFAPSVASGLPSTFVLVYGALFGAVLLAPGRGPIVTATSALSVAAIAAGSCARLVLGGHWPSQIVASLFMALSLATAANWMLLTVEHCTGPRRDAQHEAPSE